MNTANLIIAAIAADVIIFLLLAVLIEGAARYRRKRKEQKRRRIALQKENARLAAQNQELRELIKTQMQDNNDLFNAFEQFSREAARQSSQENLNHFSFYRGE